MEEKLDNHDSVHAEIGSGAKEVMREVIKSRMDEDRDIESRRNNLIIYRMTETGTIGEGKTKDKESLMKLAQYKELSIAHDLTPRQREEVRKNVKQAKQSVALEEGIGSENWKYRVVGQGSKIKVIAVKRN